MRQKEPSAPPPGEAREVLIVEDETRLREMLTRAVREMGFTPVGASTAEAALREAESRTFDILILDLNLPGMSGLDMLERLRQSQPDIQVIILTGFGDLDAARHAIRLDVVDFLTKPCALGTLEEALDRARRRRYKTTEPELVLPDEPVRFTPPPPPANRPQ
jgi:DNA-binding NtrC family response regulator